MTNWLCRRPDTLTEDEKPRLKANLDRCPEFQAASDQVRASAKGLEQDIDAVTNGLTMNLKRRAGRGRVNHIKMVKRQMSGCAGPPLLRKRILLAAQR